MFGKPEINKNGLPKLIMQTWKNETIPEIWLQGQQSLLKILPSDFKYVFLSDDSMYAFVKFAFPEFYDHFLMMPHPIQRADILRYLWLYAYGGIYLDLDYFVNRPWFHYIDQLNGPLMVLHSSNVKTCLTNSFIIAKPGLRFFLDLARDALKHHKASWFSISKHLEVMVTTGPLAFDKHVRLSGIPFIVLPQKMFLPSSPMIDDETNDHESYMKPLEGGSWNSSDSAILNFLNKYKFFVIVGIILVVVYRLLDGYLARVLLKIVIKRMKKSKRELDILKTTLTKEQLV